MHCTTVRRCSRGLEYIEVLFSSSANTHLGLRDRLYCSTLRFRLLPNKSSRPPESSFNRMIFVKAMCERWRGAVRRSWELQPKDLPFTSRSPAGPGHRIGPMSEG